jgi:hypothetical protein
VAGRWREALQSAAEIPEAGLARGDMLGPILALPAIHAARGDLPGAQHVLSVCARFESSDSIQERAAYAVGRAVVLRAEGHLNRALEAANEAISLGRRIGPDGHMFKMGLDVGLDIAFDTHALPKVQQILAAIEGLRPGEITPSLRGIEARARARLAVHGGERELAESMFKSAAAMFRELGMPLWVATTVAEQAEWLRHEGRDQQADQVGEEAAAIFERLEAKPWLRRVTGATHGLCRSLPSRSGSEQNTCAGANMAALRQMSAALIIWLRSWTVSGGWRAVRGRAGGRMGG